MRKQTAMMQAGHEERRIPWLVDMLAQFDMEIQDDHTIRVDTLFYLERELTRLFDRILEVRDMDCPSSLLLQIERHAYALVGINQFLAGLVGGANGQNFTLPEGPELGPPFIYKPFGLLTASSESERDAYLDTAAKVAQAALAPFMIVAFPLVALGAAVWTAAMMKKALDQSQKAKRVADFAPLRNLALEVRSTRALVTLVGHLDQRLLEYTSEDLAADANVPATVTGQTAAS